MGVGVEVVAVSVMAVTVGLLALRSKLNCIFSPAFSKAVMGGIAVYIGREIVNIMLKATTQVLLKRKSVTLNPLLFDNDKGHSE